jgi:hypothetical protein
MSQALPRRLTCGVVAFRVDCKLFRRRFANTKADPDDADPGNSFAQRVFITSANTKC